MSVHIHLSPIFTGHFASKGFPFLDLESEVDCDAPYLILFQLPEEVRGRLEEGLRQCQRGLAKSQHFTVRLPAKAFRLNPQSASPASTWSWPLPSYFVTATPEQQHSEEAVELQHNIHARVDQSGVIFSHLLDSLPLMWHLWSEHLLPGLETVTSEETLCLATQNSKR